MSPYLENIVISVDICQPIGENELKNWIEFSFWLKILPEVMTRQKK